MEKRLKDFSIIKLVRALPMRAMVARYIAVVMLAKKTTAYPKKSNDKSRAPATNAPRTINPTLIKP